MSVLQYHLSGKGFSKRGVRVRELSPEENEGNLLGAAKLVSADATIIDLKSVEWRNGVKLFIVSYTDPCEDPTAASVKWYKPKPGEFEELSKLFTAKDVEVLKVIFKELHEVSRDEVDAIRGKALPVSEG